MFMEDLGQAFPTSHRIYSPTTTRLCCGTSASMAGSLWVKIPPQSSRQLY